MQCSAHPVVAAGYIQGVCFLIKQIQDMKCGIELFHRFPNPSSYSKPSVYSSTQLSSAFVIPSYTLSCCIKKTGADNVMKCNKYKTKQCIMTN